MYGIVNKAIEELIVANFGQDKWELIKERSGVDVDFFISNEAYDDDITFKLANAVSEEMNMNIDNVFIAFGEWWVLKTTKDKYEGLLKSGGDNLKQFLVNLHLFHNRVAFIYPKLTPPEFHVSNVLEHSLELHYISKKVGLQEFVRGLIQGLGKFFETEVKIELLASRNEGDDHEIFLIKWK